MIIHTVSAGETVSEISRIYGVPVSRILSDNRIDALRLIEGQTLVIQNDVETYTVKEGDTIFSVADKYGTTVRSVLRYNPYLSLTETVYPGQTVAVRQYLPPTYKISTNGYAYPFITEQNLRCVMPYVSYVTPFTYGFTPKGELVTLNESNILEAAKEYGTAPVMHLSTLTQKGNFSNELSSQLFASPAAQDVLVENIILNMKEKSYSALSIDFEYVFPSEANAYADFIRKARNAVNREGYFLITALAPKTSADQKGLLYEAHDYRKLGEASDYVFLMTYEWGYAYGPPLAISPLNKVREVVKYAVTEIPAEKILLGLPNYGYDWKLPYIRGEGRARTISNSEAVNIAANNRTSIEFDDVAQSPYFYYTSDDGNEHVVWFEDARFYDSVLKLIPEFGLSGFEVWNVMDFNPQLWITVNSEYKITDL